MDWIPDGTKTFPLFHFSKGVMMFLSSILSGLKSTESEVCEFAKDRSHIERIGEIIEEMSSYELKFPDIEVTNRGFEIEVEEGNAITEVFKNDQLGAVTLTTAKKGTVFSKHNHPNSQEVVIVLTGGMEIYFVDDDKKITIDSKTRERNIGIIPPGKMHTTTITSKEELCIFVVVLIPGTALWPNYVGAESDSQHS